MTDLSRTIICCPNTHYAILFGRNNGKPVLRMQFNGGKKYISMFGADKEETKHAIATILDGINIGVRPNR